MKVWLLRTGKLTSRSEEKWGCDLTLL